MNREIKFRAWDESRKEMITEFGLLKENMPQLLQNEEDGYIFCGHLQDNGDWVEPILMQFTSLHDKNGKEIYEGDILQEDNKRGNKYKVFRVEGGFAINQFQSDLLKNSDYINLYESLADMQNASYTKGCTVVIGNIYETPELCKH